jgi:predicted RNase H-like HicB family nuclease
MTEPDRYPAQVFWSAEDEGFIAVAPDLPGCSAFGDSQQEALAELRDAIVAWVEAAQSAGNPIPSPSDPARQSEYSGKVLLRMPRDLHGSLASQAKLQNVSLNQYLVYLLTFKSTQHSVGGVLFPGAGYSGLLAPGLVGTRMGVGFLSTEQRHHVSYNYGRTVIVSTADESDFVELKQDLEVVALTAGTRHG